MEAVVGATADAPLEARWSTERLSVGEGFISGRGRRVITLCYSHPGQGGGLLRRWRMWRCRRKGKVGENCEEVNEVRIKDKIRS